MGEHARLAPMDQANLLAGHAISYATAYLRGDHTAPQLADNAQRLFLDMLIVETAETARFLIPVQVLVITMMQTAQRVREGETNHERWESVIGSLVELVCDESKKLRAVKSETETRR